MSDVSNDGPRVPVDVVIRKLAEQNANYAIRIATLEALLEEQARATSADAQPVYETPEDLK